MVPDEAKHAERAIMGVRMKRLLLGILISLVLPINGAFSASFGFKHCGEGTVDVYVYKGDDTARLHTSSLAPGVPTMQPRTFSCAAETCLVSIVNTIGSKSSWYQGLSTPTRNSYSFSEQLVDGGSYCFAPQGAPTQLRATGCC